MSSSIIHSKILFVSESKIVQENTVIVKRIRPEIFFYPFSLWPMTKYMPKGKYTIPE